MVIEIDGDSHFLPHAQGRDAKRTQYLESLGYLVVRYTNTDVVNNLDGVIEDLLQRFDDAPSFSPARGGAKQQPSKSYKIPSS